jgi:hypothetical protein
VFCEFLTDPVYEWDRICVRGFGRSPARIITEFNRDRHAQNNEQEPTKRTAYVWVWVCGAVFQPISGALSPTPKIRSHGTGGRGRKSRQMLLVRTPLRRLHCASGVP